MGEDWYLRQGIEVVDTDRGGRVTYHGPGQLVGYPIVSLRPYRDDVHDYIRRMERVIVGALADWGIEAAIVEGLTGVVDPRGGARLDRSASTSAAASPRTASRSTSTTTSSRSSGSSRAGSSPAG